MGIDVYLKWDDQTEAEAEKQCTGFSVVSGHVGYLREAYHGSPYATQVLAPECWESDEQYENDGQGVPIPAAVLHERLPKVLDVAAERNTMLYHGRDQRAVLKSFEDFVLLAEAKEAETGKPCRVYASY